jgi:adenylosuccinate synthase
MKSTVGALDDGDLPAAARDYIRMIENELGVPVTMISTGPRREETIVREAPILARLTSGRLGAVIDQRQSG